MRLYDYAGSANAYKVRLLLRQLDVPYELVPIDIFRGEGQTPDFVKKNPLGQIPVLELDDGRCVAQSNAILWHLARGTALLPADPFTESKVLEWLFFEQYEVEPTLGSARYWLLTGRATARQDELARRLETGRRALRVMDRALADRPFFVGDRYTIADIALYAYTHIAGDTGVDLAPHRNLAAWFARVEAQPRFEPGPAPYGANARLPPTE